MSKTKSNDKAIINNARVNVSNNNKITKKHINSSYWTDGRTDKQTNRGTDGPIDRLRGLNGQTERSPFDHNCSFFSSIQSICIVG